MKNRTKSPKAPKLTAEQMEAQYAKNRAEALTAATAQLTEAKSLAAEIFGRVVEPKLVIEMMPIFFDGDGDVDEQDIENLKLSLEASKASFGETVGSDPVLVLSVYDQFFEDEGDDEDEDEYDGE